LKKAAATPIHYFDVAAGAVTLLIAVRIVGLAIDPGSAWTPMTLVSAAVFVGALLALIRCRSRAYRQETPWLAAGFTAAALLAVVMLYSALHVVWLAIALTASSAALAFALVMRTRPATELPTRLDGFKLAALAFGGLIAFAGVEVGLRLAPGVLGPELRALLAPDREQYGVAHADIGYLPRPHGHVVISGKDFQAIHAVDAKGFRNIDPWPDRADIVAVGDSLTFGYGVTREQAWPTMLARAQAGVRLVNLALVGAGPQQYLRVYESFGLDLRPKLLVVGVFVRNDFWDAETFDLWLKSGYGGNFMRWRDQGRPDAHPLNWSDPEQILRAVFSRHVYPLLRASRVYNLARALQTQGTPTFFHFAGGSRVRLMPKDLWDAASLADKNSKAFRLALDAFQAIQSSAEKQGTHVLMVLQPSKEEVYLPLVQSGVPDPTATLREEFERRGIEYLDLVAAFRQRAAAGEQLFFENDGHPNPSGYALTAELVLAHLTVSAAKYGLPHPGPVPIRATGETGATGAAALSR
jgi:lysophospholipase L1-like esterase